jgi:ABC-type Fe3+ transport system substrate-binding protein
MTMINSKDTLFEITEQHPQTIAVFVSNGFPQMDDAAKRASMGKSITLAVAMQMKKMDCDNFIALLEEAIDRSHETTDLTLCAVDQKGSSVKSDGLKVAGILPCPVRLPLMEQWNAFLNERREAGKPEVTHELKAASMGLEWVQNNIDGVTDPADLPDLFLSAGFDMFFDKHHFGRFRRDGVFTDLISVRGDNPSFAGLDIKDPQGHYSMVAVVPAVLLVNKDELGGIDPPRSWGDLLHPRFEKRVSLPVSDFDLFNAILLNIYKMYGEQGVVSLGRSLMTAMHPAQMVNSDQSPVSKPAVTIMPYFFSKMVREGGPMELVWPEDGAILSPIFMLSKHSKADELQELVDFFASPDVGNLLSGQGRFPSTHPDVINNLPTGSSFMWLGWDYIGEHDLSQLIAHCAGLFNQATQPARAVAEDVC